MSSEGLASQEPSAIEGSENEVEVLSEGVSLGEKWIMKFNAGIDVIDIFD